MTRYIPSFPSHAALDVMRHAWAMIATLLLCETPALALELELEPIQADSSDCRQSRQSCLG